MWYWNWFVAVTYKYQKTLMNLEMLIIENEWMKDNQLFPTSKANKQNQKCAIS